MADQITLARLRDLGACQDQLEKFGDLFGEAAPLSMEAAVANADKFDWDWAAQRLLQPPALAKYDRVCATARAEYERVCATAFASLYLAAASS